MKSIVSRGALALVACALMGAASHQTRAQTAPGQTTVMITPAVQVISTAHYQATAGKNCSGTACAVTFPAPGANKRLNATRVYCLLQTSGNPGLNYARAELQNSNNTLVMAQYIADPFRSASGAFTFNGAVDLEVAATQHISVAMTLTGSSADYALCSISGTISTLG